MSKWIQGVEHGNWEWCDELWRGTAGVVPCLRAIAPVLALSLVTAASGIPLGPEATMVLFEGHVHHTRHAARRRASRSL